MSAITRPTVTGPTGLAPGPLELADEIARKELAIFAARLAVIEQVRRLGLEPSAVAAALDRGQA